MAIRIRTDVKPLAGCDASRLLRNELERYCDDQLHGRSVLVSGLRGAGKTTMVEAAIDALWQQSHQGLTPSRRPLRVMLLGPDIISKPKPAKKPPPWPPNWSVSVEVSADTVDGAAKSEPKPDDDERLRQRLLERVVLGLHAALSREVVRGFRQRASGQPSGQLHGQARHQLREANELAAALEIDLPEGSSPARLREFWRLAGALDNGVLFPHRNQADRGMHELAAVSGICYAYQRVSGDVHQRSEEVTAESQTTESAAGWGLDATEALKPLAALGAGTAVAVSTANGSVLKTVLVGLLSTLVAGAFLRWSSKDVRKRDDNKDFTFLPDTKAETLDRVLPSLVQRLKDAGLAPVIVIDELDKVDDLWADRVTDLLDHMKKLFAERVFTCLLVNRNYVETLREKEATDPYSRSFSYFSHRTFVSYEPAELHQWLSDLLEAGDD